ncbi:MAG: AbrB/MazE/SpoVT family DNA-binding domain-containing protein [Chloroflexota bacterium]|nr:MAG: AbrB/MazE/SpoVT family DNA-binding domain-containing protein [Chloroflexota bacterium]
MTSITRKGQVTIPKAIRDRLQLRPFDKIAIEIVGSEARIKKARPSLDELAGVLPPLDVPILDLPRIARDERATRNTRRDE